MVAVTTDIPPRRRSARPPHLLVPEPAPLGIPRLRSVRVVVLPPSAEVRRSARVDPPVDPVGRAPLPPRPPALVRVPPAAYRLRRAMAAAVVVALMLTAWLALQALTGALGISGGAASASTTTTPLTVDVAPGDTFWSIASRIQPQGDLRPLVDRLVAAHGGRVLEAGEHLSVPRD